MNFTTYLSLNVPCGGSLNEKVCTCSDMTTSKCNWDMVYQKAIISIQQPLKHKISNIKICHHYDPPKNFSLQLVFLHHFSMFCLIY